MGAKTILALLFCPNERMLLQLCSLRLASPPIMIVEDGLRMKLARVCPFVETNLSVSSPSSVMAKKSWRAGSKAPSQIQGPKFEANASAGLARKSTRITKHDAKSLLAG